MNVRLMRLLTVVFILAWLAATHPTPAAEAGRQVTARGGSPLPNHEMQVVGPSSSQYDVPPKFISGAAPIYPITRLLRREPGYALISYCVDATGRTRDFRVVKTNYSSFATHAILVMRKWRFEPAMKHGRPVACRLQITFDYRIGR